MPIPVPAAPSLSGSPCPLLVKCVCAEQQEPRVRTPSSGEPSYHGNHTGGWSTLEHPTRGPRQQSRVTPTLSVCRRVSLSACKAKCSRALQDVRLSLDVCCVASCWGAIVSNAAAGDGRGEGKKRHDVRVSTVTATSMTVIEIYKFYKIKTYKYTMELSDDRYNVQINRRHQWIDPVTFEVQHFENISKTREVSVRCAFLLC